MSCEQHERVRLVGGRCIWCAYYELLFAVGNKYTGETRHETALRYIKQVEQNSGTETAQSEKGKI